MTRPTVTRRRRLLSALALCASSLGASAFLQASADDATALAKRVDRLLAAPPSPGAEVLLIEGVADGRVRARWRASLSHADPRVRGAAARAVRVTRLMDLRPDIEAALAIELDPLAASEQADALIELAGYAHRGALAAARRLPHPTSRTALLTLMRVNPEALAPHVSELWPALGVDDAVAALTDLLQTHPAAGDTLVAALIRTDPPGAWAAVERAYANSRPADMSTATLALALAGKTTEAREGALMILLHQQLRRGASSVAPELEAALTAEAAQSATPVAEVVRELLARRHGATANIRRPLEALLPRIPPESGLRHPWNWEAVLALLSPTERAAIPPRPSSPGKGESTPANTPEPTTRLVSVSDLPPGVLEDVLRGAGCPSSSSGVAAGTVDYNELGRPRALNVPSILSESCRRRIAVLLRLGTIHGAGSRVVLVPLKPPARFGTRVAAPVLAFDQLRAQQGDTMPSLIHQVKPQYSQAAMDNKVEGKVWMSVLLDEAGVIRQLEVVRQLHPDLNRAAVVAMLGWRFKPAVHQGSQVPARVVVQMEFSLGR